MQRVRLSIFFRREQGTDIYQTARTLCPNSQPVAMTAITADQGEAMHPKLHQQSAPH